jgi:hypothetical protein
MWCLRWMEKGALYGCPVILPKNSLEHFMSNHRARAIKPADYDMYLVLGTSSVDAMRKASPSRSAATSSWPERASGSNCDKHIQAETASRWSTPNLPTPDRTAAATDANRPSPSASMQGAGFRSQLITYSGFGTGPDSLFWS